LTHPRGRVQSKQTEEKGQRLAQEKVMRRKYSSTRKKARTQAVLEMM